MSVLNRRNWLWLTVAAPLFVASCGGGGAVTYKLDGAEQKLETKSAMYYTSTMTYSAPNTEPKKCRSVTVNVANYALDGSSGLRTMGAPLAAGQTRLMIDLLGAEGTDGKDSVEPAENGEYSPSAEKFNKVRSASIATFVDGKEKKHSFGSDMKGTVKVTKSSDGSFHAEVDLSDANAAIKGSFEAKSWKTK